MRRTSWIAALTGMTALAFASAASAEAADGGPTKSPTEDGGNSVINNGEGSGTGTAAPGPGMTLKDGSNPRPTAEPTSNGGNAAVNKGEGSGTGTTEPVGTR